MSYQFITDNEQLNAFCYKISKSRAIALDTEFVRKSTFYPHLGLLQIFDGTFAALIDPLAITEWDNLLLILTSPHIEKYFHSCSEDIDVFSHYFNCIPSPIIDSQILASFLDNPISAGYATLVKKYLDVDLDKSETRTDWLKRPLSDKQCEYAINDVLYLFPIMTKLKSQLTQNGWLSAAYEECKTMVNRKCEPFDIEQAYLHIKNSWQLKGESLGQLQKLAKWRYNIAKKQDIALNFVVHEDVLWELGKSSPASLIELERLGMKGKALRLYGKEILELLLKQPIPSLLPIKRVIHYANYKEINSNLKQAAEIISAKTHLNKELLISRRLINHYIKWREERESQKNDHLPEIMTGWRKPLFEPFDL